MGLWSWLRGDDLVAPARVPETRLQQKLRFLQDNNMAPLTGPGPGGMLVHGPGATDLLTTPSPQGDGNSAVYACLAALAAGYIEPPLRVYRRTGPGARAELPAHPLMRLVRRPNAVMTMHELLWWVQWARHVDGNAYLRKLRAGNRRTGNVTELWPISPLRMELRSAPGEYISAYRYHWGPGRWEDLPPENIIHFRLGLDDQDHRRGLSPLKRLVQALTTDAAAEAWAERLLRNGAMPGLLIQSKLALTPEQAADLKSWAGSLYSGDRLGSIGVIDQGAEMAQFGFNPEQMAFDAVRRIPETRIAADLRVPAIVAGLGAGLDASTYNNTSQAAEWFTERTLMPLWEMDAAKWTQQLLADFTSDPALEVAFDLSDVRALQEDEDAKYTRLTKAVGGPWLTPNEARSDVGLAALPDGEVLFVPANVTPTPLAQLVPPKPAPPAAAPPADAAAGGADIPAAFRNMGGPIPAHKAAGEDPALISTADLAAFRERARALDLTAFADAVSANGNGSNGHD